MQKDSVCKCRRFIGGSFFSLFFLFWRGGNWSQRSTPSHRPRVDHLRGSPWTLPSRGNAENSGSNDDFSRAVEGEEEVWRVLEEALQCLGISIAQTTECVLLPASRPEREESSSSKAGKSTIFMVFHGFSCYC